jgi:hypothetical protein
LFVVELLYTVVAIARGAGREDRKLETASLTDRNFGTCEVTF